MKERTSFCLWCNNNNLILGSGLYKNNCTYNPQSSQIDPAATLEVYDGETACSE